MRGLAALGRSRPAPGGVAAAAIRPSASRRRTGTDGAAIAAGTPPRPSNTQSTPRNRRSRGINHLAWNPQHDLPELLARLEPLVGRGRLRQWEHAVDDRPRLSRGDQVVRTLEVFR